MSRTIAESVSLLSETLGNCKTNLKEKEVADVDNIKISDVDEKIAEIQVSSQKDMDFSISYTCSLGTVSDYGEMDTPSVTLKTPDESKTYYGSAYLDYSENGDEGYDVSLQCLFQVPKADLEKDYLILDLYINGGLRNHYELLKSGIIIDYETPLKKIATDERVAYVDWNYNIGKVKIEGNSSTIYGYSLDTALSRCTQIKGDTPFEIANSTTYILLFNTHPKIMLGRYDVESL